MRIYVLTYARTGSHAFGRYCANRGYRTLHEPFFEGDIQPSITQWPRDRKLLSSELKYYDKIIVWDHAVSQQWIPSVSQPQFFEWLEPQVDTILTLRRRNTFEWALSACHKHYYEYHDWESRPRRAIDPQYFLKRCAEHSELDQALDKLNKPTYYYEDLIGNNTHDFPISIGVEDDFAIPDKRDYIENYAELEELYTEFAQRS